MEEQSKLEDFSFDMVKRVNAHLEISYDDDFPPHSPETQLKFDDGECVAELLPVYTLNDLEQERTSVLKSHCRNHGIANVSALKKPNLVQQIADHYIQAHDCHLLPHIKLGGGEEDDDPITDLPAGEECVAEPVTYHKNSSLPFFKEHATRHGLANLEGRTRENVLEALASHYKQFHNATNLFERTERKERKAKSKPFFQLEQPKTKKLKKEHHVDEESKLSYFYFPGVAEVPRDLSLMWQCGRCSRGFKSLEHYRLHFRRHDISQDYSRAFICVRCMQFEAATKKEITQHGKNDCPVQRHADTESVFTYYCALCEKGDIKGSTFNTSSELQKHFSTVHLSEGVAGSSDLPTVACSACGKQFPSGLGQYLRKHLKVYGPYHQQSRCWSCPEQFKTWKQMQDHINEHHEGVFKHLCGFCGINTFADEEKMKQHRFFCRIIPATCEVKQVDGSETACTLCGEVVQATGMAVKQHLAEYHSGIAYKCELCQAPFFNETALENHIQTQHTAKRYSCSICEKSYSKKTTLKAHEVVHGEPKFSCEKCGKKFFKLEILRSHDRMMHDPKFREKDDAKTKVCDICGWEGAQRNYQSHVKYSHVKDEQTCQECGEKFNGKMHLAKHVRLKHTFEQCSECGVTVSHVYLRQHMLKKHSDYSAMPYQCTICQKGFMGKQKYNNHMNIHTGERPHSCRFCDRTFGDTANCNKHMRESHSEQYQAYKANKKKMTEIKDSLQRVIEAKS